MDPIVLPSLVSILLIFALTQLRFFFLTRVTLPENCSKAQSLLGVSLINEFKAHKGDRSSPSWTFFAARTRSRCSSPAQTCTQFMSPKPQETASCLSFTIPRYFFVCFSQCSCAKIAHFTCAEALIIRIFPLPL